ncbi:MAG: hypothetical protein K5745_01235 [Saccharofermentans sp.]|nr:hypothetical protein [Saccharofermentans sp.]
MNKAVKITVISAVSIAVLGVGALFARPLFIKAKVASTANELARAIESGTASSISSLTDKSDKEIIEELKLNFRGEGYSDEENIYAQAVRDSIVCTVDKSSVELQDSAHASCSISVDMADFSLLQDKTYDNTEELEALISELEHVEFTYSANFIKKDGEWLVTNLDSSNFRRIFSYRDIHLEIGLPSLITTADTLAQLIPCTDPDSSIVKSSTYNRELYDLMNSYITPSSDDQARFTDSVRSLMECSVLKDTAYVDGRTGTVDISIKTPMYEQLAGRRYGNIDEAIITLASLGKSEYIFTAEFTRDDSGVWTITNQDGFTEIFLFQSFSIVMADLDGDYSCFVDITDQVNNIIATETGRGSGIYEGTQGQVMLRVFLTLDGNSYSYGADEDMVAASLMEYFNLNIDTIAKNYLGTDNQTVLDTLSALAGYDNYDALKTNVLQSLSGMMDDIYFGSISQSGEYKLSGESIVFLGEDDESTSDDITGTIDSYGRICVTLPIKDPDVASLFGSDTIDLVFVKDEA